MKKYNVILLFNKKRDKILMCKRVKEPYKGKLNLVGGKLEQNEDSLEAAYRELQEETGIIKEDVELINNINFEYLLQNVKLEVFSGVLNKEVDLVREVNELYWIDRKENFFDIDKFAGEGNIGHMLLRAQIDMKI